MNSEKIKQGVALILEGIGEDTSREGLLDTPDRIARMCEEIFGGLEQDAAEHFVKKFHATNNNMVLEKILRFIPSANITCCRFTARLTWPTSPTTRWRV